MGNHQERTFDLQNNLGYTNERYAQAWVASWESGGIDAKSAAIDTYVCVVGWRLLVEGRWYTVSSATSEWAKGVGAGDVFGWHRRMRLGFLGKSSRELLDG